jgi:anti-sigma factor RsiW
MSSPEKRDDGNGGSEARIAAYLCGETTSEEAAAFEHLMEADEALGREVEQWRRALDAARDWMAADAPGVERVAQLAAPSLHGRENRGGARARVLTIRAFVWRAMAAAAIFALGIVVGQKTGHLPAAPNAPGLVQTTPTPGGTGPAQSPPVQREKTPAEEARVEVAGLSSRYTDEKGRLIIETTLKGSGTRAMWVVDGTFQLAQFAQHP